MWTALFWFRKHCKERELDREGFCCVSALSGLEFISFHQPDNLSYAHGGNQSIFQGQRIRRGALVRLSYKMNVKYQSTVWLHCWFITGLTPTRLYLACNYGLVWRLHPSDHIGHEKPWGEPSLPENSGWMDVAVMNEPHQQSPLLEMLQTIVNTRL